MKQIEDLWVKVSYEVRLGDLEMPQEVYDEIVEAGENYKDIEMCSLDYAKAEEWLSQNIKERDCMEWKAEIIELREADA